MIGQSASINAANTVQHEVFWFFTLLGNGHLKIPFRRVRKFILMLFKCQCTIFKVTFLSLENIEALFTNSFLVSLWIPLIHGFKGGIVVYDIMDDWEAFSGWDKHCMKKSERNLFKADFVFCFA